MKVHVKYELEVTPEQIADAVCACFEGGYSSWCYGSALVFSTVAPRLGERSGSPLVWYATVAMFGDTSLRFSIEHQPKRGEEGERTESEFTLNDIQRALTLMAEKHSGHFRNLTGEAGEGDAFTGDCLMQLLVYGEMVFG